MTVRRRVREGALPAERVRGKFGPEWRVYLEAPAVLSADHPMSVARNGAQTIAQSHAQQRPQNNALTDGLNGARSTDQGLIAALREAQATTAQLFTENARLQDERAELFGRLGFYQAQLQQAQETIKALQAPAVSSAAEETAPQDPPTRPWWRFW